MFVFYLLILVFENYAVQLICSLKIDIYGWCCQVGHILVFNQYVYARRILFRSTIVCFFFLLHLSTAVNMMIEMENASPTKVGHQLLKNFLIWVYIVNHRFALSHPASKIVPISIKCDWMHAHQQFIFNWKIQRWFCFSIEFRHNWRVFLCTLCTSSLHYVSLSHSLTLVWYVRVIPFSCCCCCYCCMLRIFLFFFFSLLAKQLRANELSRSGWNFHFVCVFAWIFASRIHAYICIDLVLAIYSI